MTSRCVVVVGGGIAGLAAAHRLVEHARAGTVNDHPLFIRMLAEVVRDHAA